MPDSHRKLYDQLKADGLYTKSYSDFVKQFSNPEKIMRLHQLMKADGLYTRTVDDFTKQFFSGVTIGQSEVPVIIPVKDTRIKDLVTQQSVSDKSRLHVNIDSSQAKHIITKAKEYGIDPYTALAMVYQETGFKEEYSDNPFNLLSGGRLNPDTADQDFIDLSMQEMLDKQKLAERLGKKTDEEIIQAWNGYGKIGGNSFSGTTKKAYGLDVSNEPLDMNEDPVYGRRVVDIRDNILKQNPEIVKLVDEASK